MIGPSDYGVYCSVGNGAEGVLVQSSSDLIGVVGAGNIISANAGDGVQLDAGATQVQVAGNYIGVAPGGGFMFGNPPPGNGGDGVDIIGAANNTVGGNSAGAGNTISSNAEDGVAISGATATGNIVVVQHDRRHRRRRPGTGQRQATACRHVVPTTRSGRGTSSRPTRSASASPARRPRGSP